MQAKVFTLCLALIVGNSWGMADEQTTESNITVSVQGMQIIKPAPDNNDHLLVLQSNPGIKLGLLINAPKGGIVAFGTDSSTITSFVDDIGKDLQKIDEKSTWPDKASFGGMPAISKDGKY